MLKRPAEINWSFRQPTAGVWPSTPGANGVFLGPSASGKSTTLIALLLGPYKDVFDEVHVFSPSVDIDSAWLPVKEYAAHQDCSTFHSEWDEQALRDILDKQRLKILDLKQAKTRKELPQVLVIIDDFSDRPDVMHASNNVLTTLFIRGRHLGASTWLSSQHLTSIARVARVNFRFMVVFRLRNAKELQSLMEELSALYPISVLHEMYQLAVQQDYSFWYVNLMAKRKELMFFERFEKRLVVE